MSKVIKVGIADMNYCQAPDLITTIGLGSCVGVVLFDAVSKKCGMVHVMLPDSTKIINNTNAAKFADTGIQALYNGFVKMGISKIRLKAKIAGGAQMFAFGSNNNMMRIGDNNVAAVKKKLAELGIPIVASDTGSTYGRTITFNPDTCKLNIKIVGKEEKEI